MRHPTERDPGCSVPDVPAYVGTARARGEGVADHVVAGDCPVGHACSVDHFKSNI
jgi:hypothetical protein